MRIQQIDLSGFGSYQQASIDLREISSAVIMGPNGAGKSTAFVDAVLWALFGRCRTATDAMLRIGSTEMGVNLTFELNGQIYRILRKRSLKTKAGKSDLEFQVKQGGDWTPISGARLADTQQKILDTLNADYDLLTSTGFLLQGNADRFSRATPAERKTILSAILRLDQYGPLKQAASRAASTELGISQGMAGNMVALEEKANQLDDLLVRLNDLSNRRDAGTSMLELLSMEANSLTETIATQKAGLAELGTVAGSIQLLEKDFRAETARHNTATAKLDRLQQILKNATTIREKHNQEEMTKKQLDSEAQEDHGHSKAIEDLDKSIASIQSKVEALSSVNAVIAKAQSDLRVAVQSYHHTTKEMQQGLERDSAEAKLLGQVPCTADLQKRCQFTKKAMEAQGRIESTGEKLSLRHANAPANDEKIGDEMVPQVMCRLREYEERKQAMLADGSSGVLEGLTRERAMMVEGRRKIQETIRTLQATLSDLQRFTKLVPELELAEGELPAATKDMQDCQERIEVIQTAIKDLRAKEATRATLESEISRQVTSLKSLNLKREGEQLALNGFMVEIGQVEQKVQESKDAQAALKPLQQERAAHARDASQYQTLSEAYSLIPVLILENSIPILEQETNAILSKVSSSGMRVRLDTQKALKSRDGLAETLEIIVRDVKGERPYENYSGGERFRLDLSLRIGLAKLLANRAGARLETLVIDEGLGSLDEDGLTHLRDCLAVLGQEFSLCLVITHVESMKHTFPSQIVVTDKGNGSQVEVIA